MVFSFLLTRAGGQFSWMLCGAQEFLLSGLAFGGGDCEA